MSDTPRTDAVLPSGSARNPEMPHIALELAGLSRSLERENAALRDSLREMIAIAKFYTEQLAILQAHSAIVSLKTDTAKKLLGDV